jgi:hypothetical protein
MNHEQLITACVLNDLQAEVVSALNQGRIAPGLLLCYSYIDICASLSFSDTVQGNRERFLQYLKTFSNRKWTDFTPLELWSARCSLLHSLSPFGDHTNDKRADGARPLFYYARPATKEGTTAFYMSRGYTDFVTVDCQAIKYIAIDARTALFHHLEEAPAFEKRFTQNAKILMRDPNYYLLDDALCSMARTIELAKSI